jgi:hypothetical protein
VRRVVRVVALMSVVVVGAGVLSLGTQPAHADPITTAVSAYALDVPGSVLVAAGEGQTEMDAGEFSALLANKTQYDPGWQSIQATYGTATPANPTTADAAQIAQMEAETLVPSTEATELAVGAGTDAAVPLFVGVATADLGVNVEKATGIIHDSDFCGGTEDAVDQLVALATGTNCAQWRLNQALPVNGDENPIANFAIGSQSCNAAVCGTITSGPIVDPIDPDGMGYCASSTSPPATNFYGHIDVPRVTSSSPPSLESNLWWSGGVWTTTPYPGMCSLESDAQSYAVVPAGDISINEAPYTGWRAYEDSTLSAGGTPIQFNITRTYECVITFADGGSVQQTSPAGSEGDGQFYAPECPAIGKTQVPVDVKIYLTSPEGTRGETLLSDQPTTQAYQNWKASYPGCGNDSCLLDLQRNGVSCLFQQINCDGWNTDPNEATTYTCLYGGNTIALTECNIYSTTFNATNRANGHAYADPSTGEITDGQTSPSDADLLTTNFLRRTSTPAFAALPQEEQVEYAGAAATACLNLYTLNLCETKAVWLPGSDVSDVATHDVDAIASGQPGLLTYVSAADKIASGVPRSWYTSPRYSDGLCSGTAPPDQQCDEYPYYSTLQGGPTSVANPLDGDLRYVNGSQNGSEGGQRRAFYSYCGLNTAIGDNADFIVVPAPELFPTFGLCALP